MQRPNILIIYTDQQRWSALGANGNTEIHTPNLDALARESINYDHCFVQHPLCMPSRLSFLSGRYPSQTGVTHMGVPVPENVKILPHYLSNYGYHCANIGKLHFLPHANRDHREIHPQYGFDQLEISDEPGPYEDAYRAHVRLHAPDQLEHLSLRLPPAARDWQKIMSVKDGIEHPQLGKLTTAPFAGRDDVTHSAFVGQRTMDYLNERKHGEPFLCIAGFYSPHEPWVVPQKYLDLYDPAQFSVPEFPDNIERPDEGWMSDDGLRKAKHGYYAMISEVDDYVGQIIQTLRDNGQYENTVIVFTSDHGEWLGEFGRWGKGFPGEDAVSRVPLLVRIPGAPNGQTVSEIVEAVDVLPTLLRAVGIPIPEILGGTILPRDAATPGRTSALMETEQGKTVRTARFRYVARADGSEQLFDLTKHLGDYADVAALRDYAADLSEMRREMIQRLLEIERPLPRIWAY